MSNQNTEANGLDCFDSKVMIRSLIIRRLRECLEKDADVLGTLYAVIRNKKALHGLADPELAEILLEKMQRAVVAQDCVDGNWRSLSTNDKQSLLERSMDAKTEALIIRGTIKQYFQYMLFMLEEFPIKKGEV